MFFLRIARRPHPYVPRLNPVDAFGPAPPPGVTFMEWISVTTDESCARPGCERHHRGSHCEGFAHASCMWCHCQQFQEVA